MAQLTYTSIVSLDGYVNDPDGRFDWAVPDDEVHEFANDLDRPIGTHLYGRRMYEVMSFWETVDDDSLPPVQRDYASVWRAARKIVYSTTLSGPLTAGTRVERTFDVADVRRLKEVSATDLAIAGPTLAAHAIRAGLVDEYRLLVHPVVIGGGVRALPDGARRQLDLIDQRRFASGVVYLCYRDRAAAGR